MKNVTEEVNPQGGNTSNIKELNVNDLTEHPLLKGIYDDSSEALKSLTESIKEKGILNRIVVTENNEIISGTRRWKCAKSLGIKTIPGEIRSGLSETQIVEIGLSFNVHNPKNVIAERNECNRLFDIYSKGQGKKAGGNNTIAKISKIIGTTEYRISHIRCIDKYYPELLTEISEGNKSLDAAYKESMKVKKRIELCEKNGTDYQKDKKTNDLNDNFKRDLLTYCSKENPSYVEIIETGQLTPEEAYDEIFKDTDKKKRKTPKEKHSCPFCDNKNVTDKKVIELLKQNEQVINEFINKLKNSEY